MIPFTVMMANLIWEDGRKLEVRIAEPFMDGFSFRVSKTRAEELTLEHPAYLEIHFLDYRKQQYISRTSSGFTVSLLGEENDMVFFRLTLLDKELVILMRECLAGLAEYIRIKEEYDESSVNSVYTGIHTDPYISPDLRSWKKNRLKDIAVNKELRLGGTETAVVLDSPRLYDAFLSLGKTEFVKFYFDDCCLTEHPISRLKITHLYIGNMYCHHLMPDKETLETIISNASAQSLIPVLCIPPLREGMQGHMLSYLEEMFPGTKERPETVVNDLGTARALEGLFPLTAGPFVLRAAKDPRTRFTFSESLTPIRDSRTKEMLRSEYGFSAFSYEAGSDTDGTVFTGDILHLPLYRTNTSSYCPLYALVKNKDRGAQEEPASCPRYCEEMCIMYPDDLGIIGLGCSLFACDTSLLEDTGHLESLTANGIKRLVVKL